MGYRSVARNEITFYPELPRCAQLGNGIIYKYRQQDLSILIDTESSTISPPEDDFKAYWIVDELKELVTEILKINPETNFTGYIEIEGEGDGSGEPDLWRLRVRHGKVEEVRPTLVWPED